MITAFHSSDIIITEIYEPRRMHANTKVIVILRLMVSHGFKIHEEEHELAGQERVTKMNWN